MPSIDVSEIYSPGSALAVVNPPHPVQVSRRRLQFHAAFTGGALPASATALQRFRFRRSCMLAVGSAVTSVGGKWRATSLFRTHETTEKAYLGYRLGMAMAGVFASTQLNVWILQHRQALFGSSSGPRGDLLGKNLYSGAWHGIEAKGHGPDLHTGGFRYVSRSDYEGARDQAKALAGDLINHNLPAASDHWAVTTRAAIMGLEVVSEDPEPDEFGHREPPGSDGFYAAFEPEERLLQAYYQVLGDVEEASRQAGWVAPPRIVADLNVRGVYFPTRSFSPDRRRRALWIGARSELFEARSDGGLSDLFRHGRPFRSWEYGEGQDTVVGGDGLILGLADANREIPRWV